MSSSPSARKIATIPCGYLANDGTWYLNSRPSYVDVYSSCQPNFPSPRKKPHPLSPTYGQVQFINGNPKSYNRRIDRNQRQVGTATFVYQSGGPIRSRRSDADAAKAVLAAVAKSQSFNAAADVAEGGKTFDMIAKRLRTLSEAAFQLKRGNASAFAETLGLSISRRGSASIKKHGGNEFHNLWLEYTYGWRPLVGDVYEGIEAYRHGMATRGTNVRYSSGKGAIGRRGENFDSLANSGPGYRGTFSGTISNPTVATLNQFGLANPFGLAWELLPYSFVVDWFAPVGNIMTSITAGLGWSNKIACMTWEDRTTLYCRNDTSIAYSVQSLIRRELVSPPTLLWRLGSLWAANLGWQRYTSAYSLLRQRFGR